MAQNQGTLIITTIRPTTTDDNFPVIYVNEAKGGYMQFSLLAERDALPLERRTAGMEVYVLENDTKYRLNVGLTNLDWVVLTGGATTWDEVSNKPTEFPPEDHLHDIGDVNGLQGALDTKIEDSEKGSANGVATLDETGKIPSQQLPGGLNSVIESYVVGSTPFASGWLSDTEGGSALTPASNTIYSVMTAGTYQYKTYMWGGSSFIEISPSLVLGETSNTAYRGDRGKTAYDHSQVAHAPANAQKNSLITKAEIEAKLTGEIQSHTHPQEDYPYVNPDYPTLDNQTKAIDWLLYTPLVLNTFTPTTVIREVGDQYGLLELDWTLNKDVSKLTECKIVVAGSDVNLIPNITGMVGTRDITLNPAINSNTSFPFTVKDIRTTLTRNVNVEFRYRRYFGAYGDGNVEVTLTNPALLPSSELATSRAKTGVNVANSGQYTKMWWWYCYPASWGNAVFTGPTGVVTFILTTVEFVHPTFGNTVTYKIWRSPSPISTTVGQLFNIT